MHKPQYGCPCTVPLTCPWPRDPNYSADAVAGDDTLADAVDAYKATWARTDAVVNAESTLDERCRGLGDDEPATNLRWVLIHLLEETARHAGHDDILRELIDGQTGR